MPKKNKELKTTTIRCEGYFTLLYDPESPEFVEAYNSYIASIDRSASVDDMLTNAAHQLRIGGHERMLEGIGYVRRVGAMGKLYDKGEPFSGIYVKDADPDFEYEIE
jgi:hypothetical protein